GSASALPAGASPGQAALKGARVSPSSSSSVSATATAQYDASTDPASWSLGSSDIMPGSSQPSFHHPSFSTCFSAWRSTGRGPTASQAGRSWPLVSRPAISSATQNSGSCQGPKRVVVAREPGGRFSPSDCPAGSLTSAVRGFEGIVTPKTVMVPTDN